MAHLSGFGLENFRVFKEYTWFNFAPITILVGPNSSGKSSLIKALLLLKANKEHLFWLDFNVGEHNLVSFKRVLHNQPNENGQNSEVITFKIPLSVNSSNSLVLKYRHVSNSNYPELIYFDSVDKDGDSFQDRMRQHLSSEGYDTTYPEEYIDKFVKAVKEANSGRFMTYLDYFRYLPITKSEDFFGTKNINDYEHYTRNSLFSKKWFKVFDLELGQTPVDELTGKRQLTVNGRLLKEVGSGIKQIVALLLSIADDIPLAPEERDEITQHGGYTYILEEPEANLHPNFQSKLAELLVDAYKSFGVHFIIETHSEYLIRKLQVLTRAKQIEPSNTVIHYFYPPKERTPPKSITIREDGRLSGEFGSGFFDEAANLMISLLTGQYLN